MVVFYSTPFLDASDFPPAIFNTLINMHIFVWCQLRRTIVQYVQRNSFFRVSVGVKLVLL